MDFMELMDITNSKAYAKLMVFELIFILGNYLDIIFLNFVINDVEGDDGYLPTWRKWSVKIFKVQCILFVLTLIIYIISLVVNL